VLSTSKPALRTRSCRTYASRIPKQESSPVSLRLWCWSILTYGASVLRQRNDHSSGVRRPVTAACQMLRPGLYNMAILCVRSVSSICVAGACPSGSVDGGAGGQHLAGMEQPRRSRYLTHEHAKFDASGLLNPDVPQTCSSGVTASPHLPVDCGLG
jgi:hypothetical protein